MKKMFVLAIALIAMALTQGGCSTIVTKTSMDGVERIVVDPSYGSAESRPLVLTSLEFTGNQTPKYLQKKHAPSETVVRNKLEDALERQNVGIIQSNREGERLTTLAIRAHSGYQSTWWNLIKHLLDPFDFFTFITYKVIYTDCTIEVIATRADGQSRTYHAQENSKSKNYFDNSGQKDHPHTAKEHTMIACAQKVASDMAADVDWLFPKKDELALR